MVISGSAKRARGVAITRSPKATEFRASANGRPVHHHHHRAARLQHCRAGRVKRVQHLEGALRRILADVHAATKCLALGGDDDGLEFLLVGKLFNTGRQFAEERFIQEVVFRVV